MLRKIILFLFFTTINQISANSSDTLESYNDKTSENKSSEDKKDNQSTNSKSIEIIGNDFISEENIFKIIGFDPHNPNKAILNRLDIELRLRDSGLFTKIEITEKNNKITIKLSPAIIINQFKFEGNKSIKTDVLLKVLNLKPGISYTKALENQIKSKLTSLYAAKNIHISCDCKFNQEDKISSILEINIKEAIESKISNVKFIGLKKLTAKQLLRQISPTPTGFFSSSYELPLLDTYIEKITKYAQSRGYCNFYISGFSLNQIGSNNFEIFFTVEEGEQCFLESVEIENALSNNNINLNDLISKLSINSVLSMEKVEAISKKIIEKFEEEGFSIYVKTEINDSKDSTKSNFKTLKFKIIKAEPNIINQITVSGNKTSNRDMIVRISDLVTGQKITQKDLTNAKTQLLNTGFFKQIDIDMETISPTLSNLNIKTEEVNTILLSAGVNLGYGVTPYMKDPEPSIILGVKLGYCTPNFLGKGYTINADIGLVTGAKMFNFSFGQSSLANSRNIGWNINLGLSQYESGISYKHKEKDYNTFYSNSDPQEKYLIPNFTTNSNSNPRQISLEWNLYRFNSGFDIYTSLNQHTFIGISPFFALTHTAFEDRDQAPRIYQEDMYAKNIYKYGVEFPFTLNFLEVTNNKRKLGFFMQLKPIIDNYNYSFNFNASYTIGLDPDTLSSLSFKIAAGFSRSITDKTYWHENYRGTGFMTGFTSWGARELISFANLGGREFIAAQAKLILPIPTLPESFKFYCFAAAGTIGNSGIDPIKISDDQADKMGFRKNNNDILNDEHSLRVSTGLGFMLAFDASVFSVGINFPLVYKEGLDRITFFYFNMSTSIDNA